MYACPSCGSRSVEGTRTHTLYETIHLTYTDDQGTYTEEDVGSFGESIDQGDWKDRECDECGTKWPDEPEPQPPAPPKILYWELTYEHRHGTNTAIFTHTGRPDMAVLRAYAKRVWDYDEDDDQEFVNVEICDPFLTYAEIAAEAQEARKQ